MIRAVFQIQHLRNLVAHGLGYEQPHAAYTELLLSSVPEMDPDWLERRFGQTRARQ
jgi:ABC-type oligopeptide transport system ATPase subunit